MTTLPVVCRQCPRTRERSPIAFSAIVMACVFVFLVTSCETTPLQNTESPQVPAPVTEPSVVVTTEPAVVVAPEPAVVVATEPAVVVTTEPAVVVATEPAVVVATEPAVVVAQEPAVVVATEPAVVVAVEPAVVVAVEPPVVVAVEPPVQVAANLSTSPYFNPIVQWNDSPVYESSGDIFRYKIEISPRAAYGNRFYLSAECPEKADLAWIAIYFGEEEDLLNHFVCDITQLVIDQGSEIYFSDADFKIGGGIPRWNSAKYFQLAFQSREGRTVRFRPRLIADFLSSGK